MAAFSRTRILSLCPLFWFCILLEGCANIPKRPCTQGGQSPHPDGFVFRGTKKCFQVKDSSGQYVNDGKYYEWYTSEKIAVTGEYKLGKKVGRWIEYDRAGNKISDRIFDDGKELPLQ